MNKMNLSDLMIEKDLDIQNEKLNLIVAPTGSGKTHYFFKHLAKQYTEKRRILYLVDTNMLEESMLEESKKKYKDILTVYDPSLKDDLTVLDRIGRCKDRITVMSYAKVGLIMKTRQDLLDFIDLIVVDEAQNLINYSNFQNDKLKELADDGTTDKDITDAKKHLNNTARTLYLLPEIATKCNVVMLSATPNKILKYEYWDKNLIYDVVGEHKDLLKSYKDEMVTNYAHIKNLYRNFKKLDKYINKKILIYTERISTCKQIWEDFEKMGYNTMAIWSEKNPDKDKKMTDEQIALKHYLIKNNVYPDDLDVLIINSAYETGWNLKDKRVQTVICNTTEMDSVIQSRGRCRHDIEELYINAPAKATTEIKELSDIYLDRKLTTADKDELCKDLDIRDKKGTLKKWTSVKKALEKNGYKVVEERTKKERFHIIHKK